MTDDEIRDVFMVAYTPITEGKSADDDAATVAALRVGLRAVERAARAAAFDDVVAGIRAVQAAYDEQEGRPNVPGSVCSDCIGVVNALRARAEGDGEGGR